MFGFITSFTPWARSRHSNEVYNVRPHVVGIYSSSEPGNYPRIKTIRSTRDRYTIYHSGRLSILSRRPGFGTKHLNVQSFVRKSFEILPSTVSCSLSGSDDVKWVTLLREVGNKKSPWD